LISRFKGKFAADPAGHPPRAQRPSARRANDDQRIRQVHVYPPYDTTFGPQPLILLSVLTAAAKRRVLDLSGRLWSIHFAAGVFADLWCLRAKGQREVEPGKDGG
jgi:hypothetical protein